MFEIELFICKKKMDLALNNFQRVIYLKIRKTHQPTNQPMKKNLKAL